MDDEAITASGMIDPALLAAELDTIEYQVVDAAGLDFDADIYATESQGRLREMVDILNRAEPRFGSAVKAYSWYRSEPLPGFSGQSAMDLVRDGRAAEVLDYIRAVDAGLHN